MYKTSEGFIVHNSLKPFKEGHTHLSNYNVAKHIIFLALTLEVPDKLSKYLLVSLIRLSTDARYIRAIESKIREEMK